MKAILIDPVARTVAPLELDPHDNDPDAQLAEFYRLLGIDTIDIVTLANGDTMVVDDEGLLKRPEHLFWLQDMATPLAGRALVHGTRYDAEGDDYLVDAASTVDDLKRQVRFVAVADDPRLAAWLEQFG